MTAYAPSHIGVISTVLYCIPSSLSNEYIKALETITSGVHGDLSNETQMRQFLQPHIMYVFLKK